MTGKPGEELAALRRAVAELGFLADLARVTASALDPAELFRVIITRTCAEMAVAVCSLYVVQDGDLVLTATNGLNPASVGVARMPVGVGITGDAARRRVVIPLRDARADPRFHWIDGIDEERFAAMCSVPVVSGGARVVGVLTVQREDVHDWSDDETATLTAIASQLAGIIERSELQRMLLEQLVAEREATERWRRLTQSRSDLLSIVSHDVRTPLMVAQIYAEGLADRLHGEERTVVDHVLGELGHVTRMVETVLSALALEAGAIPLLRGDVDLAAFLEDVCARMRPVARGRRIDVEHGAEPVAVSVDADRLGQVVSNLLVNAIRHSPEAGTVTVRLERAADAAVVRVCDTGPGVPAALRGEVFERFRRGDGAGQGTGLGLFIVKTIVDAHGGSVGVDEAPGGGACFWFRLPLVDAAGEAGGAAGEAGGAPGDAAGADASPGSR